jgi:hypothetical protein
VALPTDASLDLRVDLLADVLVSDLTGPPPADAADARGGDGAGGRGDAATARVPRPGEVAIVEALANPGGNDLGREWIELESFAAEAVNLGELHLADAAMDVAVPSGTLAPGGRIVIAQSADPGINGGVPFAVVYGTRLVLNNTDESLSICLGPCAFGVVLHRVSWQGAGADFDGHAMTIDPETGEICPASLPFGTAGDFGTPGAPNPDCPADR